MRLKSQSYRRKTICKQIDKQQVNRCKRNRKSKHRCIKNHQYRSKISRKQKLYGIFYVLIYISSVFHSLHYSGEIIICKNHSGRIFRNFTSRDTHSYTYISLFKRRRIIYTVPCHGHDVAFILPSPYDPDLVFRRNPCINRNSLHI